MKLKQKKEQANVSEEKNTETIFMDTITPIPETEETKASAPEKKPETKPDNSDLRKKAEKVLEDILLGNLKPSRGMKISLSFKGPFNLLGVETTAESTFQYNYPDGSNEEETPKQEAPVTEKQETPKEPKLEKPKPIF